MARKKKRGARKWIFPRGHVLWCRLNREDKWVSRPTPYKVGQEINALRYAKAMQSGLDKRREPTTDPTLITIAKYAQTWTDERSKRVDDAIHQRASLEKHCFKQIGQVLLTEARPRHFRDLVRILRETDLAPRTILNLMTSLHGMFQNAIVDELVQTNPIVFGPTDLPDRVDADPEWRMQATFTRKEVQSLISDPRIATRHRVLYALKALAGLRHGEAAALCWRHYDPTSEPLGTLTIARAYRSSHKKIKSTKTNVVHDVPVHGTLGVILDSWRRHWERLYGHPPGPDDLILPNRNFVPLAVSDASKAMTADLETLGFRTMAGESRHRGGHDLRSWFLTKTIEDGADSLLIDRVTHAPPRTVTAGYLRFPWEVLCREVSKLKVPSFDLLPSHADLDLQISRVTVKRKQKVLEKKQLATVLESVDAEYF